MVIKLSRLISTLFALVALTACTSLETKPSTLIEIAPNKRISLPLPNELNEELSVSQLISVNWQSTQHQLPVQLEITNNKIELAGFSSWGTRILSLTYTGTDIETEVLAGLGSNLPDPKQVLFYLMLTLWPQESWSTRLDAIDWKLAESPQFRALLNERGQEIVTIEYSNQDKLTGDIVMKNSLSNYQLTIQTLSKIKTSTQQDASLKNE